MEEEHIAQFWSHGRDLQEEGKFKSALNQLLKEFRKTLDDSSPLAKSIGDNAPSRTKAIIVIVVTFLGYWMVLDERKHS